MTRFAKPTRLWSWSMATSPRSARTKNWSGTPGISGRCSWHRAHTRLTVPWTQRSARTLLQPGAVTMPKLLHTTRVARQTHILRTAVVCFARQGYYGTTMEEIAAEAGIAKGAAYVYFPSKEALFFALYEGWGCTLREEIMRALATLTLAERNSARRVLLAQGTACAGRGGDLSRADGGADA